MSTNDDILSTPQTARVLGHMVTTTFIEAASDLNALRAIKAALDAGDVDKARLIANNQLPPGSTRALDSLQRTLYQSELSQHVAGLLIHGAPPAPEV